MCSPENVKLINLVLGPIKILVAIYIVYVGSVFCDTVALHRAYGEYFIEAGAGLIILGLLSGFLVVPAFSFGLKRHNRFIIISCFAMDTIIMSCLLHLGATTGSYLVPEFSKDLQSRCLFHTEVYFTQEDENGGTSMGRNDDFSWPDECSRYLTSDRTSGFRLVWAGVFSVKSDAMEYSTLKTIQDQNGCCGFFPPLNCEDITSSFPPDRPLDSIKDAFTKQRLKCGDEPYYYPVQDNCEDLADANAVPRVVGGCRYDMAVGSTCLTVTPSDDSFGCVSAVEDYVAGLIEFHVTLVYGFCPLLNFIGMVFTCCMFWKRKEGRDVFPDFLAEAKFEFNYANVKDQFEVKPMRKYLIKHGFYEPNSDDEENNMPASSGKDGPDQSAISQ